MLRNNFAALAVAYLSTTLVIREQVHQNYLTQHYTVFEHWRMIGAEGAGYGSHFGPSVNRATVLLYHGIQAQAAMLSFNDLFRILAFIAAVLIPGPFLLRRLAVAAQTAGAH
jgi:hypothetical protein